jgi:hypothetical protein
LAADRSRGPAPRSRGPVALLPPLRRTYAAPAVVLAEALPVVELMLAVDIVLVTLLPALVALAVGLTTVSVLPVEDKVPVLLVVTAEALLDVVDVAVVDVAVVDVAVGNCCSMTST